VPDEVLPCLKLAYACIVVWSATMMPWSGRSLSMALESWWLPFHVSEKTKGGSPVEGLEENLTELVGLFVWCLLKFR